MKIKFNVDTDLSGIVEGLQERFKTGMSAVMTEANDHAMHYASQKLRTGLSKWIKGYKVNKVSDEWYVISIEGQMANWMEDGMEAGELSKAIMSGNRASSNKAEGKNYVDVPIAKDSDNLTVGGKSGPKLSVKAFKDADSMMKSFTTSDWKKGGTKQKQAMVNRVKDIVKNQDTKTGTTSYMTIRRVSEKSMWPKSPTSGAKVLDETANYLEQNFVTIMERYL